MTKSTGLSRSFESNKASLKKHAGKRAQAKGRFSGNHLSRAGALEKSREGES
ncbi:hypothetical protein [Algoriphagus taiwanensis]|uniref:Stress-induced protein n=1 Tax=Algoriphagus taiwanensis TaxID=1445656 RepID=A0ABQ6Q2K2_9BACT|nr:hypothetical protein Ataiwa_25800 [Algoriphagus taiwanensis]